MNPTKIHQPTYHLYKMIWDGLDWLYPPRCGGCELPGFRWCPECEKRSRIIMPPICNICGQSLADGELCRDCRSHPPAFKALRSWFVFEGSIRTALHRLKYRNDMALGETFSFYFIQMLFGTNWSPDVVIPVPLGIARHAERGYNQASLMAYPLALATGVVYRAKALKKNRETLSQVGLSFDERRENVRGAFYADSKWVNGKRVLLIDDVCTSGATLEACSVTLLEKGAIEVYALTLARASLDVR